MKRVLFAAGAAAAVAVAVIAATGASSAGGVAAVTSNISIRDRVGSQQTADFLHKGKFHLLVNSTLFDSGGTSIRPLEGNSKTLGGQNQTPISGTNTLTGKKGTLTITLAAPAATRAGRATAAGPTRPRPQSTRSNGSGP